MNIDAVHVAVSGLLDMTIPAFWAAAYWRKV